MAAMRIAFISIAFLLSSAIAHGVAAGTTASQSAWGVNELGEYRLTPAVFEQFDKASRLIAAATRDDPRFIHAPLFTKEIALAGEVQEMAIALEARLTHEPLLASALKEAGISPHDYAKFAIVLIAARYAQGFIEAGVLRSTFGGAAGDNVKFVGEHKVQVVDVLTQIGVE